jgi:hypothetical protein
VRSYRQVKRSEALEQDNQHHALRECNWYIDDDGAQAELAEGGCVSAETCLR